MSAGGQPHRAEVIRSSFKDLRMKSFRGIYFVGLLSMAYSLPTIKYAVTTGQLWYGVFALLPLIGAVGLFLRRSWARFPIYAFSVCVVPTWVAYTMWFLAKKGWPYYSTTLESVLGLVPGLLLCGGCALGSWIVHQHFRP